jgi:hypothetical protein
MNFGGALECLKRGMEVQREGWPRHSLKLRLPSEESDQYIYLIIRGESSVPWIPSQEDMLSEDWNLV